MFRRFSIAARGYSAVNSYLTMVSAHKLFAYAHGLHDPLSAQHWYPHALSFFLQNGARRVALINNTRTDTQGVIADFGGYFLISLRGSESPQDWMLTNANIRQVTGGNLHGGATVRLHAGFREAARSIDNQVKRQLNNWGANRPIVIAGHSLGSGVATLLSYSLSRANYIIHSVYAHASPMVGDARFGQALLRRDLNFYRTVNQADGVPEFPQVFIDVGGFLYTAAGPLPVFLDAVTNSAARRSLRVPYEHTPVNVAYISESGRVRLNPSREFIIRDRGGYVDATQHETSNYNARLWSAIPSRTRNRLPLIV